MSDISQGILNSSPQSSLPNSPVPQKPLPSLGFLISVCFDVFGKQFLNFFSYALVIWIPFLVLVFTTFPEYFSKTPEGEMPFHPILILPIVFSLFYSIGIMLITKKALENEPIFIGGILSEGIERFFPAFITFIILAIAYLSFVFIGLGISLFFSNFLFTQTSPFASIFNYGVSLFLVLIFGIYCIVYFIFSIASSVLSKKSHVHAIEYSRDLVRGHWWSVFWKMLGFGILLGIGILVVMFVVGFITGFVLVAIGAGDMINSPILEGFFFFVGQFLGGISAIFLTLLFLYLEQMKNALPPKQEAVSQDSTPSSVDPIETFH